MANIKFSGFTAPGGSFTPSRTGTFFVGYDNSGGPDNIRLLTSDIESLLNWPTYQVGLNSTNPEIEFTQPTGYSYGGASGTVTFTGAGSVATARTSSTEITITGTDTNFTYSLATAVDGSDIDVNLTGAGGGSDSTYKVTAGSNITLTPNGTAGYDIAAANTNTTSLPIKNGAGTTEFTATDTTGLRIVGGGSVVASYISGSQQVALTGTDTNTTYSLNSSDNGSSEMRIFLLDGDGTLSGETFLEPGSNITITETSSGSGRFVIAAAASTSWTLQADTGSSNVIDNGETVDIAGGTYLSTVSSVAVGVEGVVTINHDTTTRTDTTSVVSPVSGGTFTVIDTLTTNTTGHVTAANVKSVTLPSAGDTYDLNATGTLSGDVAINLTSTSGTDNSSVQLTEGTNITLTRNSATEITIDAAGGGGGSGLTPIIKTASYTAVAGDFIICDVTGIVVITLPASPSVGDLVGVKYASQNAQTDQLRIQTSAAGDLIDKVDRSTNFLPVPSVNTYFELIYGSANNWYIK